MINFEDKLDLRLNQNLWGLAISLASLGFSEFFHLSWLLLFAKILSVIFSISVTATLCFYTVNYCKGKYLKIFPKKS